jgi:hypothetical protein
MSVRSTRGLVHVCAFGVSLATCAVTKPAPAQVLDSGSAIAPPKDAEESDAKKLRELMRTGVTEYRKKNLEGARQAFAKAWETSPRPEVAAALADVEMKLGRYRDAAEHWDFYLQSKPADQAEAAARLDECRVHVAAVRIELEPAGAQLEVDGTRVPTGGSGGTVWSEPGPHSFTAQYEGRTPVTRHLDLTAGQDLALHLAVAPPTAVASAPPPAIQPRLVPPPTSVSAPQDSSHGGLETRTIVTIGGATLTVAAAAVGGWFLIQRADAQRQSEQLLREVDQENPQGALTHGACLDAPQRPAKCNELVSKNNEVDRDRNWAIGSFATAGVLGAATTLTYLLWPTTEKHAQAHSLVIAPLGERGTRGLQLSMAF